MMSMTGRGNMDETGLKQEQEQRSSGAKPSAGMADMMAGETKEFIADLSPYLPQESKESLSK